MHDAALSPDGTQMLGGGALVLAVVLLCASRARACIGAGALQSWTVALAMGWQGWVRAGAQFSMAALIVLAAQGVLIPVVLVRASRRPESRGASEPRPGASRLLLLGLAAAVLAILAVRPIAAALAREHFAVALAVALLGLIAMATRRDALIQAASLSSMLNGALLAAMPGTPMPAWLALAAALLAMAAALGAVLSRGRERPGAAQRAGVGRQSA